ncbi:NYN domain-containing protein [bacterium]|nr:NYN domain-containing protein [bacterium]
MQKERTLVAVDASNLHYALKHEGWQISYERFVEYFRASYDVVGFYYYEGTPSKSYILKKLNVNSNSEVKKRISAKKEFFGSLRKSGLLIRTKPVTVVYDSTKGIYKAKCNFDVEITIDAIDRIQDYDAFILLSGDGDFMKLLKYVKGKYKKTIVISAKGYSSEQLRACANQTIFIHELKGKIEEK